MTTSDSTGGRGGWSLAIDLGTSYTSATVAVDGRAELLLIGGEPRMPSTVAVDERGELLAGVGAERVLARSPDRAERNPKRRIGDEFVILGGTPVSTVDALATIMRLVADEARARFDGSDPATLVLTHPARWGAIRLRKLVDAAARAGLPEPLLVPEPIAAAWTASTTAGVADGAAVAIYDLGGGTLDIAVVRRVGVGFEVVGPPGGSERIGGEMFDERLFQHLGESLASDAPDAWEQLRFATERTWRRAAHDFRAQVRSAKEALSTRPDDTIYVGAPVDRELRLTRDELEEVIEPDIAASITELADTIARAALRPGDLAHVFLVGGGSRVPHVAQRVGEWLGAVPSTWGDPKSVVALGAHAAAGSGRHIDTIMPTGAVPVIAVDDDRVTVDIDDPPPPQRASRSDTSPPDVAHTPQRRRGALVTAGVAIVAVIVAAALVLGRGDGDETAAATTTTTSVGSTPSTTAAPTVDPAVEAQLDRIGASLDALATDLDDGTIDPVLDADRTALASLRDRAAALLAAGANGEEIDPDAVDDLESAVAAFADALASRAPASSAPSSTTSTTTSTTTTVPGASVAPTTAAPAAAIPTTTRPRTGGVTGTTAAPTTTQAPIVTPAPTTTVATTLAPTTTARTNQVPYVVGMDFTTGAGAVTDAGYAYQRNTVDCATPSGPGTPITEQSHVGAQPLTVTVVLTVCR